jgi:protein subunit release factor A
LPTSLVVRPEAKRSQLQNRELALGVLRSKLVT